jgi:drug/metabolite transporter (DMT)-like permease
MGTIKTFETNPFVFSLLHCVLSLPLLFLITGIFEGIKLPKPAHFGVFFLMGFFGGFLGNTSLISGIFYSSK